MEADRQGDSTRAVVLVPVLRSSGSTSGRQISDGLKRSADIRLAEAIGLAEAIELEVVHAASVGLSGAKPSTLFGSGKVEEIADILVTQDAGLVVVDHPLTPVQQRNLEKAWQVKVIDRTGLILEIFGRRATTREGVLQVELAHLNYQKGRLVRSWTHLETPERWRRLYGRPRRNPD